MTEETRPRAASDSGRTASNATLASNVALIGAVILVVLWPVTGHSGLGVVALGLLVLAAAFAGMNASKRVRKVLVRPENACSGGCAGCSLTCDTPGKA
jgi:hypothetical protein